MATPSKRTPRRKNRGNIDTLRNGSLRVRGYAGTDPITGKRCDLKEFIPAGPTPRSAPRAALVRLINEVNERRHPKTSATVNQLLDKYLDVSTTTCFVPVGVGEPVAGLGLVVSGVQRGPATCSVSIEPAAYEESAACLTPKRNSPVSGRQFA